MKILIAGIFSLFTTAAVAGGVYYDPEFSGEGIVTMEDDGFTVTYFYTYGAERCDIRDVTKFAVAEVTAVAQCPNNPDTGQPYCAPVEVTNTVVTPYVESEKTCDYNGQRWFIMADPFNEDRGWYEGLLYAAEGIAYPEQFISRDATNPFGADVADVFPVAIYALQPSEGGGYKMRALQLDEDRDGFPPVLDDDDFLFDRVFDFNAQLFGD